MSKINRRNFFAGIGTGFLGLKLSTGRMGTSPLGGMPSAQENSSEPKIIKYNKLGKTGLKTSDIIFGSTSFSNPNVARYAYDLGVNVFDTAENYQNGLSEEYLGKALKGIRDKVVIITKHFGRRNSDKNITKKMLIDKFDASLKRLQTDYIDVAFTHNINGPDFWKNEELLEAYEALKKQGKLRFSGFSTHVAPTMLKECLKPEYKDFVQVVMFMYNHMEGKEIEPLINQLRSRGIGTIAMKTMAGGRQGNLKSLVNEKTSYPHAALSWVLGNKAVDCAVISMRTYSHVEEYISASGKALQRSDLITLKKYQDEVDKEYCRVTCNKCEGACPEEVAISDIMRYEMYFKDYGHEKVAVDNYKELTKKKKPNNCKSCVAYCEKACPHELNVKERLLSIDKILSA